MMTGMMELMSDKCFPCPRPGLVARPTERSRTSLEGRISKIAAAVNIDIDEIADASTLQAKSWRCYETEKDPASRLVAA